MLQLELQTLTGAPAVVFALLAGLIGILCCVRQDDSYKSEQDQKKKPKTFTEYAPVRKREKDLPFTPRKKPIPGISHAVRKVTPPSSISAKKVRALRGGEFVGNRMRFKVKVNLEN